VQLIDLSTSGISTAPQQKISLPELAAQVRKQQWGAHSRTVEAFILNLPVDGLAEMWDLLELILTISLCHALAVVKVSPLPCSAWT
jgi:hypothetical protein